MIRTLPIKSLGFGFLAAVAISALTGSSTPANTGGHFTFGAAHTTLEGEQTNTHLFNAGAALVFCKTAKFKGTTTETTTTEITIAPAYDQCTWADNPVKVLMNDCQYVFTIGKKAGTDNTFHLVCPEGSKMELEVHGKGSEIVLCEVTVAQQTPNNGVVFETGGSGSTHSFTIDITLKVIVWEQHGWCETLTPSGTGPFSGLKGAEYEGKVTLKGFNTAGEQVAITATGSED